jgi:hypothetical protein
MIPTTRTTGRFLGIGIVAAALGGAALVLHPATAGQALAAFDSVVICNGSSPCDGGTNQGIGAGVKGISLRGNGIAGQTNAVSTSQFNGHTGVYGLDASRSGAFDSGVLGISTNGFGVVGTSTNNNGTEGFSRCSICSGVYGETDNGGFGVAGRSATFGGIGVVGDGGPSGIGVQGKVGTVNAGLPVIEGLDGNFTTVFEVDDGGNIHITGDLFSTGLRPRVGTKHVASYTPRASVPTIEDAGEATLRDGSAYVALDSAFASVIDDRYVVFITPEGDNGGLYVTGRTLHGFQVREARGGHSSVSFAYRILAHPYGQASKRLPSVDIVRHRYPPVHG